jgi:hypothetical protein
VDQKLYTLLVVREQFAAEKPDAASAIDIFTKFYSAADLLAYLPRAAQIAFLSPFPAQWFERGSEPANTGLETVLVYLSLVLLPYAVWIWRRRPELWVCLIFNTALMMIFSITIPNVGMLYRVRYGFIMCLVAIGFAGGVHLWQKCQLLRQQRASPSASMPPQSSLGTG